MSKRKIRKTIKEAIPAGQRRINDGTICGTCKFHNPPNPVILKVPTSAVAGRAIIDPTVPKETLFPLITCCNPESVNFMVIMTPHAGCELWNGIKPDDKEVSPDADGRTPAE